jgi:pimeloyl-ACP methyl ester carboxylesterase
MMPTTEDAAMDVTTRLGALRVRVCGSGPPAVLWHSLFADSTTWDQVCLLLGEPRQLIAIDGPSRGSSAPTRRRFTSLEGRPRRHLSGGLYSC